MIQSRWWSWLVIDPRLFQISRTWCSPFLSMLFLLQAKHTLWRHVLWSLDYFYLLGICTSYGYYISIQLLNVGVMGVVQCLLQVTKDMEPDSFFFSPWYCRFVGNDPSSAPAVYSIASDCRLCFVFEFSIPLGLSDCRVSFVFEFSLPLGLSGCR